MFKCKICPFECGTDREKTFGVCKLPNKILVSHYQPHFWEEPCVSGKNGSGAIFFSGCNGQCVFCQNWKISQKKDLRKIVSKKRLYEICRELIDQHKVENINFVSPTPYSELLIKFLKKYKSKINVPIVWNSNGYEKAETIKKLKGLVDIYLPDLKYFDNKLAVKYSKMPNYFKFASQAITEMFLQNGKNGLIVRLLVLPGMTNDSKKILKWIRGKLGREVKVSLLAQYYPTYQAKKFPEINRKITEKEYQEVLDYFDFLDFRSGFCQELSSASSCFTPDFRATR